VTSSLTPTLPEPIRFQLFGRIVTLHAASTRNPWRRSMSASKVYMRRRARWMIGIIRCCSGGFGIAPRFAPFRLWRVVVPYSKRWACGAPLFTTAPAVNLTMQSGGSTNTCVMTNYVAGVATAWTASDHLRCTATVIGAP